MMWWFKVFDSLLYMKCYVIVEFRLCDVLNDVYLL